MDMQLEIQQGKNLADISKAAGVERLIWSSLPNVTEGTKGAITAVEHFDSKAQIEAYIREIGQPATFFMPGMFMTVGMNNIRKLPDGKYYFTSPFPPETTQLPLYSPAEDTGTFVAAALLLLDETLNKRILGTAGYITPNQIVKDFKEATGVEAGIKQLTWEQFHDALPPVSADELTGNFKLVVDFGYYVGEPEDGVEKSLDLVKRAGLKAPVTWKEFAKKNWKEQ
jgi:nucleoside-diphosphate-sugar epimerase